jgi:hypothetical protein
MADLKRICRRFTRFMHHAVCAVRASNYKPKKPEWIEKLIVFYSLERCRDLIPGDGDPVWCHFTLGAIPKGEAEAKVREVIENVRGLNFKDPAATTLSEYIVDFSFSTFNLRHLFGSEPMPENRKFRLLLAAESEMDLRQQWVLDDFVKLLEVKSPVKIVVFQARTGDQRTALLNAFQGILRRHGRYDPATEPDWLFVGIPPYSEWVKKAEDPEGLNRQVHIVHPGSNPAVVEERADWWAWTPAAGEE